MSVRSKRIWHRCPWCRGLFRPREASQVYCSHKHYSHAKRKRPEPRPCAECGRIFLVGGRTRTGRRRAELDQRFHSRACASRARERQRAVVTRLVRLRRDRRAALGNAIDGEGWISGRRWVIEIGNTSRPWLRTLRQFTGGIGSIREERRRKGHWKRFWRWRIYGASAYALLVQCFSEFVVKRARAQHFIRTYAAHHSHAVRMGA